MNAENFSSFLLDPSKLYQIPYQELKSLVVQYPYCQPLRVLLLQKSQMDQHPDFERNLQAAAAYLPDRRVLYLLVREYQAMETGTPLFELEEERLELKALSEILAVREPAPADEPAEPIDFRDIAQPSEPEPVIEEEPEIPEAPEPEPELPKAPAPDIAAIEALFEEEEEEEEEQEPERAAKPAPVKKRPAPLPKSAFASWDARYGALRSLLSFEAFELPAFSAPARPEEAKEAPAKSSQSEPAPVVEPQALARKSVAEKDGIVSETLAELLVRQGHAQKAIAMYEKLSLIFPEKSSFFAQKIELLKRK
jgi:hypothetical protein